MGETSLGKESMFVKDPMKIETTIELAYFDIPLLHTFTPEGNAFFDLLAGTPNIYMFEHESIKKLIDKKWVEVVVFVTYFQFLPHLILIFIHLFWQCFIRECRSMYPLTNVLTSVLIFLMCLYYIIIEIIQFSTD